MLKGVTQRQIIVLYALLAVLVLVVGLKYLIFPMMEDNDKKESDLFAKVSDYDALVLETQQAQFYEDQNKQLLSDISEISKSFQNDIKASNIDYVISSLISKSGLEVISLSVSEAQSVTDALLTDQQTTETQQQTQSESNDSNSQQIDNIKSVTTQLTTSGTYPQLVKLIELVANQKSMYMKDLTFTMQVNNEKQEEMEMNFSIVSFVYSPEAESEQSVEEETTLKAS